MATVSFKVFKHHKKGDGLINVKLVIYHKKRVYPDTKHYVALSQLKRDYTIKDKDLLVILAEERAIYLKRISNIGERLNSMTVEMLRDEIMPKTADIPDRIDFIAFGREYVTKLLQEKRNSYAGTLRSVVNNLVDFMKTDVIYTGSITSDLLRQYEAYLRKPHLQIRTNQFGRLTETQQPGMEDSGIYSHMKDFRILFKAARDKYNDEDLGLMRIPNYPFKKYKLKEPAEPEKRAIPIDQIIKIRDIQLPENGRAILARDIYMLSFYLCGMNAKDMYLLTPANIIKGRVVYNRSKTMTKRADNALFSVKLIPEAAIILNKYIGTLKGRYSTHVEFNKALSAGSKQIAELLGIDKYDPYSARHTFATEARNTCGHSVDDVAEVLNHKDSKKKTIDGYIKRSWSLVDKIQKDVISLLSSS